MSNKSLSKKNDFFPSFFEDWDSSWSAFPWSVTKWFATENLPTSSKMISFSPKIDCVRQDNQLVVKAELAGLEKDDFEVVLNDGYLTIKGEKKLETETEDKKNHYYSKEISYGSFERNIPVDTDELAENAAEHVKASFKNGIIEVTVPMKPVEKKEVKATKRINVE